MEKKIFYLLLIFITLVCSLFIHAFFSDEGMNRVPEPSFVWEGVTYILTFEPADVSGKTPIEGKNKIPTLYKGNEIGVIKKKISSNKKPKNHCESNYLRYGEGIFDTNPSSMTEDSFYYALVVKYENEDRIARPLGRDVIRLRQNN